MSVLITRPGKAGIELTQALLKKNINVLYHPFFEFNPGKNLSLLTSELQQLKSGDIVFSGSQQVSQQILDDHSLHSIIWPNLPTYLAIGRKSAEKLSALTQRAVYFPNNETSEGVLQLPFFSSLIKLKNINKALILRGNGGRELLIHTLLTYGYEAKILECYQRNTINYDRIESLRLWKDNKISTICVTSYEILQYLINFIYKYDLEWLKSRHLIVGSQTLHDKAQTFGFKNITNLCGFDNQTFYNFLTKQII